MSKTLSIIIFFLLLLPFFTSPSPTGLDSFLSTQFHIDPLSSNDTFASLPSSLLHSLSSPLPSPSPLPSLQIPIPFHIKLVGSSSPSLLSSLLSASPSSSPSPFLLIHPSSHLLSISHSPHLLPSISPHLLSPLSSALHSHLFSSSTASLRSPLHPVPFSLIDDIIHRDFDSESASAPGFYLYLLNLPPQDKPYAYSYSLREGDSPHYSNCLGSIYTGASRYAWVDLAAGPVDYGPALSGDGGLPRGEFHPLAALHRKRGKGEKVVMADLASLVLSAYKALVVPSLRIPVHYENNLLVQLIHVRGAEVGSGDAGLDWGFIEKTIREGDLSFRDQELRFRRYGVGMEECAICSFAVAKSMSSYTSRFLFENYTLIVSEYLDSKQLRHVLAGSVDEIHKAVGIRDEEFGRVLPVYVFDLDYNKVMLLDRYHQTVAFRDMVIAVRTRTSQTVSDYSCNGRHVITQTRNLDRPIIASILQSMWGVSPTHLSWSPQHNTTLVDYTWSVGQTPFGPFSDSSSISFVQKDAARRNVLLTSLNYTVMSAADLLESVATHGGDRKLLKNKKHLEYVQRWNLLRFKLEKLITAMSHLDYDKAMYYLRSSDYDLYAIHNLVYQATQNLEASLVCFKDPPFPWVPVSVSGVFVFGLFYAYTKRDKIFKSKRKQF